MNPTRQEFLTISGPEKVLFYVLAFGSIALMIAQIIPMVRQWQRGRPLGSKPNPKRWLANVLTYVLAQKKVRSSRPKTGAPMHLMIFFGFLTLLLATTLLAINTYSPIKFHQGNYYLAFEMISDTLGFLFVIGVTWALLRRLKAAKEGAAMVAALPEGEAYAHQREQNRRYPISHHANDLLTLGLLLLVGVTGYVLEAARMALDPKPFDWSAPVGYAMSGLMGTIEPGTYKFIWWFHMAWVFVFFAVIPRMRLRHIVLAILSTAGKPDEPMGRLRPVTMEEVEQTEQVGVKLAQDYSRWHLMSLDACMECGRCTEVCPAWNVGKVLNPKQVVQDIRAAHVSGKSVAETVSEEALWACTTCNACVEACPVLIRHVDLIVDSRRNLVSEGALSGTAAVMLRQTASTGHAWGQPTANREDWMKGLDIPLCRDGQPFEYLFWVGCAGATDPGAIKTTRATAELMKKAGISFACLGREETCTGDPARRVGEEFLFQEKAGINVAAFERYGVKRVVTICPHCLNTLKNEYGDFGAKLEVFHHTQLLSELVRKGQLLAAKPDRNGLVFHDPCYLGRVNEESQAPRTLVSNAQTEPEFHHAKTRCCGAGGGRMWMEEPPDQRPSNRRAEELLATGAKTVALGCPFCRIMLDSGIKQVTQDEIRLVDLAELLQEVNESQ